MNSILLFLFDYFFKLKKNNPDYSYVSSTTKPYLAHVEHTCNEKGRKRLKTRTKNIKLVTNVNACLYLIYRWCVLWRCVTLAIKLLLIFDFWSNKSNWKTIIFNQLVSMRFFPDGDNLVNLCHRMTLQHNSCVGHSQMAWFFTMFSWIFR